MSRVKGKNRKGCTQRERGKEIKERERIDSTDANSPTKTECIKPKAQPARATICINVLAAASHCHRETRAPTSD